MIRVVGIENLLRTEKLSVKNYICQLRKSLKYMGFIVLNIVLNNLISNKNFDRFCVCMLEIFEKNFIKFVQNNTYK